MDRPLRYIPKDGGFSILNGKEFFNRPLYGPNIPFRVDGGDLPEFSLYLPGHGGNLRLGVGRSGSPHKLWAFECQSIHTQALEGRLRYEVRDPLLGSQGLLIIEALTEGAGLWVQIVGTSLPHDTELLWAFGGVSGRKGKRNGDIGCEEEPITQFFQVRPAECSGNTWTIADASRSAEIRKGAIHLTTSWPQDAELHLGDAALWSQSLQDLWASASLPTNLPVLMGKAPLGSTPLHLSIGVLAGSLLPAVQANSGTPSASSFATRRAELANTARTVRWTTPDPFLDSMAGALNIAADAIWDDAQGCVMHGAVAWRMPLAGWRGPYALNATGKHDRMRRHLQHWMAKQNRSAVMNGSAGDATAAGFSGIKEAEGTPDPGSHGARTENLLHSAGDLSHNHYDMNLVFFDALLRHLRWTGDLDFAREAWPALELHAAWERRLFRRDYGTPSKPMPLYEAYAAIWASDNLQYNGGGATHSSAYNVFLNRNMAELATALGMQPGIAEAHRAEAAFISTAMRQLLWIPEKGAFAEGRDWLADRRIFENPAVWTVYHTIDSEVTEEREAWQMASERLRALRKVPIRGNGVPSDAGWQLACSDWHPYVWSLTLLVAAENFATSLALFQAGMADQAYGLLRGTLLDAGFRGLCPGNFPMSLQLDPHRQESQRDFGDPIGCGARAILQGLWGVKPNLLKRQLTLRPQLPLDWQRAELVHPDLAIAYRREGDHDRWEIQSHFNQPVGLTLELRARTTTLPRVTLAGKLVSSHFVQGAVGEPRLRIDLPTSETPWIVEVHWEGTPPHHAPAQPLSCVIGKPVRWPANIQTNQIDDPQDCLRNGRPHRPGGHTVFALQKSADCEYWVPLELEVQHPATQISVPLSAPASFETIPLDDLLTGHVRETLSRPHTAPRSGLCSLNLPSGLLGGWANFDVSYPIDDIGLRKAGGQLSLQDGLHFRTPATIDAPNCRFISHWQGDTSTLNVPIQGRARAVHLLLVATTFPQATSTPHASLRLNYTGTTSEDILLSSPNHWWPIDQDYEVDDYLFRFPQDMSPDITTSWRVDLRSGAGRPISQLKLSGTRGGIVQGGSGFVLRIQADPKQDLRSLEIKSLLFGVVLGVVGITLERE